ncbi:putative autophagy protein Atg8 ubiquitin [Helianthus debilis subsp. tardiflorus]
MPGITRHHRQISRSSPCNPTLFRFLYVVVERYTKTDLPEMEKKKYLVPRDMSIGQFIHIPGSRLHLAPGKALFIFVHNTLPQTSNLMESVYGSFKDEDGFLYMCYSSEKTFGNING